MLGAIVISMLGFMACDAQRVICRIDECRGWSAGLALAPVMFRAQLNEQDLPLSLTVVALHRKSYQHGLAQTLNA